MKITARMAAMTLALLSFTTAAKAEFLEPYAGFGLGVYTLGITDRIGSETDEAIGAYFSLGVDIAKFLGAEVRLGTTTNEAMYPWLTGDIRAEYIVSYLGKVQLPFNNGLRFYVLGGGTTAIVHIGAPVSDRISRSGYSFGGGFDYQFSGSLFSDRYRIGVEAIRYWHNVELPTLTSPPFSNPVEMSIDSLVGTLKYEF